MFVRTAIDSQTKGIGSFGIARFENLPRYDAVIYVDERVRAREAYAYRSLSP